MPRLGVFGSPPLACAANVETARERPMFTETPSTLLTDDASDTGPRCAEPPSWPISAHVIQKEPRSSTLAMESGHASRKHSVTSARKEVVTSSDGEGSSSSSGSSPRLSRLSRRRHIANGPRRQELDRDSREWL